MIAAATYKRQYDVTNNGKESNQVEHHAAKGSGIVTGTIRQSLPVADGINVNDDDGGGEDDEDAPDIYIFQ